MLSEVILIVLDTDIVSTRSLCVHVSVDVSQFLDSLASPSQLRDTATRYKIDRDGEIEHDQNRNSKITSFPT